MIIAKAPTSESLNASDIQVDFLLQSHGGLGRKLTLDERTQGALRKFFMQV